MSDPDRQLEAEHQEYGLVDHLRAAIRQNVARRADYRRRGGLRAWGLSVVLVAHERSLLPFAALLDRKAKPFQREGIPILAADLQPMHFSPPPGRQLEGVGAVPWSERALPAAFLWETIRAFRSALRRRGFEAGRFRDIAAIADGALYGLELAEGVTTARFALTGHVLESLGLSAINGLAYAEPSDGQTVPLSRRFVAGQVLLLPGALSLDLLAGPAHARGVPIFIDDVPPVPFREAWQALQSRQLDSHSALPPHSITRCRPYDVPSPEGRGTEGRREPTG
ncbi:MAG: hypothetical protein Rubg2KO_27760 [Rubricoccaceae bacterium]